MDNQWYELDYVNICTKLCASYLSDIPDDIELMNEEIPGTLEREFKSKWKDKFDMNRIPGVHPFEMGMADVLFLC